ncbi:hypothetical protein CS022_19260 [Veronia nyctiphanis]|uniref:DUF1415 domain-containing protein n=1 Tax=Veronia nyctiphanis TaxID=1278244 RepID=A0A4Q0YNB7_9GAMM|nr:DUF1415 domain-containing protein [Veronia nyctiphanis]RXJ71895.1 hypothetical protein CS022_19260 [Veronia nyctiphanis]
MSSQHSPSEHDVKAATEQWLSNVVIGLNLCPFAAKPQRNGQILTLVCESSSDEVVMEVLCDELKKLDETPVSELETTMVVTPNHFTDFDKYNQFLDVADMLIDQYGWRGTYQVASFHPDYCFADAEPDCDSNLTNRSPYPVFHLIREESIEKALRHYGGDPEDIPDNNVERVCTLSDQQKRHLFPYLFSAV